MHEIAAKEDDYVEEKSATIRQKAERDGTCKKGQRKNG